MSLTTELSPQPRIRRVAPASDLQAILALPALAAAIFFTLAPVDDPRPSALPGQSCQQQLAAAEAVLDAREGGGEVAPAAP